MHLLFESKFESKGYKDHTTVDNAHKLIHEYKVTSAEEHDSNVFEKILTANTSKNVWADSAYRVKNMNWR